MKIQAFTILFFVASLSASAQLPIKWKQTGTWSGWELVINQDPQNILLTITNTTLKKSIPKTTFSNLIVHDTVKIAPNIKTTPEYIDLAASLAQTIRERDLARLQYESEVREHENTKRKILELTSMVRKIRAIHEMDTAVLIWMPKTAFKKGL